MTIKSATDEERLLRHLEPKIREIVHETLKEALPNEIYYPPESKIKKSFVKRILEAEKRIEEGEGNTYTYNEFKKKFLKGL